MQPLRGLYVMKIITVEKILLGCTAAFLILTLGYYLGVRNSASPFQVVVESRKELPLTLIQAPVETAPDAPVKINLNTATAEELMGLPGIGDVRVLSILTDREKNGPFRIVEDITRVDGIGEGTLADIIELITVD